jgi:hypothetical protein
MPRPRPLDWLLIVLLAAVFLAVVIARWPLGVSGAGP